MASETDHIMDRRRLKRSRAFWRILAILAIVAGIGAAAVLYRGEAVVPPTADQIARIEVSGAILEDRPLLRMIERIGEDDRVKGVIVAIDSPGGSTVGGESLYKALRTLDGQKPVVAHIGTIGTSAAYMTALAADHIVAWRTSITGSIGVLVQYGQVEGLLEDLGIEVDKVATGPLKAEPSPFGEVPEEALEMLQDVVNDSYEWFVGLVAERRNLSRGEVIPLADGRIMTGHQALEEALVDAVGSEEDAVGWLEAERGVEADLPVRTWEPRRPNEGGFLFTLADRIAVRLVEAIGADRLPAGGFVDGLRSIWQGPAPRYEGAPSAGFE